MTTAGISVTSPLSAKMLSVKCNSTDVTLNTSNTTQENSYGTDDIPCKYNQLNFDNRVTDKNIE